MSIEDKLITIAENEPKVFAAGEKSEYDRFWDNYQKNGRITSGSYMFANEGWNDETFKPKYSMESINNANYMFNTCRVLDFKGALERAGITINFSQCPALTRTFSYMKCPVIPEINASGATSLSQTFMQSDVLQTIEKLILKTDGTQTFSGAFEACKALENITIEGVIGRSVDFSYSPLTVESMKNIILHLKDYTGTSSEYAYSVKFSGESWNLLTEAAINGDVSPENTDWETYIMGYLKWNT